MPEERDKIRENRLRRMAKRMGWRLRRSRARILHLDDLGDWMLADENNGLVCGARFDADLDEVEEALGAEQKRLAG